jgi:hypothetical protein
VQADVRSGGGGGGVSGGGGSGLCGRKSTTNGNTGRVRRRRRGRRRGRRSGSSWRGERLEEDEGVVGFVETRLRGEENTRRGVGLLAVVIRRYSQLQARDLHRVHTHSPYGVPTRCHKVCITLTGVPSWCAAVHRRQAGRKVGRERETLERERETLVVRERL